MINNRIKKVLIVERGEMGLRALDACIDLKVDFVVGFSEADKNSMLVKKALDFAKSMDGSGAAYLGSEPIEESYGNVDNIIETAKLWGCDAVYSGYGPLAEDHLAIKKIERARLKFIGPNSGVVELFSNKSKSRELAQKNGLKLLKAFNVKSVEEIARICLDRKLKYPFIIKSFFSGGGRGNHLINNDADLAKIISKIDVKTGQYYVEEYISGKHIELQFVVDSKKVLNLGTRDCSCQIDFQKVLEECPAKFDGGKIEEIEKKINKMLVNLDYEGVGTAEFIYDKRKNEYYFLEINPRIQVEAPITEKFFDMDLIKTQFLIAAKQEINFSNKKSAPCHVIEARIYARDVFNNFKHDSGKIEKLVLPQTKDVTIFSSYHEGDVVSASYDPLVLKIVCKGKTREESIRRLKEALLNLEIEGVANDREFILWLIGTNEFKKNQVQQDFAKLAWQNYLKDRNNKIENFLKKGNFIEHKYKSEMNPDKFPNKLSYFRDGISRDYIKELKTKHKQDDKKCAFQFGILKKDGVECVFAWWDFSYFGGTLGIDEAIGVKKCFEIASHKKLPVLMISNSGGARQQENAFALQAMHYIVAARKKYSVPLFVNIYYGDNFGGVNASIVEQADIQIAVKGSRIGLTGPKFLSKIMTKEGVFQDASQSVIQHYQARNIDLISSGFEDACEQALSIFKLLFFDKYLPKKQDTGIFKIGKLNLLEILNPNAYVFEETILLADENDDPEILPVILGAFVKIGGKRALVLGQHVPLAGKNNDNIKKKYIYPAANDFRWFRRKMRLAEKLKIPIILFGDTSGADAGVKSEYGGISYYISNSLADQLELTVPIISVNIGLCGSGGGLPFVNTADFAIAFEKSLKLVSNIEVQSSIMTGVSNPTEKQQNDILQQLVDATAKFQKKYCFVDEIIAEKNEKETVLVLKKILVDGLQKLVKLDSNSLVTQRFKRIERVIKTIT